MISPASKAASRAFSDAPRGYTEVEWTYAKPSTSFEEVKVTYTSYLGENGVPPNVSEYLTVIFTDLFAKRQDPNGAHAVLIADFLRGQPPGAPAHGVLKLGDTEGGKPSSGDAAIAAKLSPLIHTDARGRLTRGAVQQIARMAKAIDR